MVSQFSHTLQLLNQKIIGATSGGATVVKILPANQSENNNNTLHTMDESSGDISRTDLDDFDDGENLITAVDILSGVESSTLQQLVKHLVSTISVDW